MSMIKSARLAGRVLLNVCVDAYVDNFKSYGEAFKYYGEVDSVKK